MEHLIYKAEKTKEIQLILVHVVVNFGLHFMKKIRNKL